YRPTPTVRPNRIRPILRLPRHDRPWQAGPARALRHSETYRRRGARARGDGRGHLGDVGIGDGAGAHRIRAGVSGEGRGESGPDRQALRRLLHRLLKHNESSSTAAVRLYGRQFRRTWSSQDLSTRARRHGLETLYEFYRMASSVLHGTAGGSIASTRRVDEQD